MNPIENGEIIPAIRVLIAEAGPIDAVSLTGGEPLAQAGFLRGLVEELALGVPILLETNGVLPDQLRRLIDVVDIVSMDMKPPSSSGERAFWAEHEEFLQIARAKEVYVKVVVDRLTALADIALAAQMVSQVSDKIVLFLQPMMDADDRPMISGTDLDSHYKQARQYLDRVRVAPQVHKLLKIQ